MVNGQMTSSKAGGNKMRPKNLSRARRPFPSSNLGHARLLKLQHVGIGDCLGGEVNLGIPFGAR